MALRLVYYAASRGIATLSNLDMQQCPKTFCNNVQKYFAILSKKCLQKTAQAEIEKKEKRQREGIDSKKARGEWDDYGRPAVMSIDEFSEHYQKVVSGEIRPFELMKQLGMSKSTYYRYVKKVE